jgi:sulfatase modifying factor 1
MRRLLLALAALCALGACGSDVKVHPSTQITVRLHGSVEVVQQAVRLRVQVATPRGAGWHTSSAVFIDLGKLKWPVDVPVVPGPGQSRDSRFEFVVDALDGAGTPLAQARAVTSFVARQQRLLELTLAACPTPTGVCAAPGCHGQLCKTCELGTCVATGETPGESLDRLDPDARASNDPATASDAGDGAAELDAGKDAEVDPVGDAAVDEDAGQQDGGGSCPQALRCHEGNLEECEGGLFTIEEDCEFACFELACTGVCEPGTKLCGGAGDLVPQTCGEDGQWSEGERCPFLCQDGACVGDCEPGTYECTGNTLSKCSPSGLWEQHEQCGDLCRNGACDTLSSCSARLACADGRSCCESEVVPGGTFSRSYDATWWTDPSYEATVSTFRLDRFEVTVGRFRAFANAFLLGARPRAGEGRNLNDDEDPGWLSSWDSQLPATEAALREALAACPETSWTDSPGDGEDKPINCVTWFEAMAFCIWDEGRLPTEAEWNYAAAGGDEHRIFPWSTPALPEFIDETYAVYHPQPLSAVGARPSGLGRWEHADLGGNVEEWLLDWYQEPYLLSPCVDCAEFQESGLRSARGGAYGYTTDPIYVANRSSYLPRTRSGKVGFRCARAE